MVLLAVCLPLFFTAINSLPLLDPDEPRCAIVVRNMIRSGNWWVPMLDGGIYYDKPAPYFWLVGAAEILTGSGELAGRGVSALSALLAVVVTWRLGRRIFGPQAGLLGAIMLASSGMFLFVARWYRMDMPFTAAMWAALWFFWRGEDQRLKGQGSGWGGWLGFYICCGVACLFKGIAGLGIPGIVVGGYLLLSGRPRRLFEVFHVRGLLGFSLVALPFYISVCWSVPQYAQQFFGQHTLARFGAQTFGGAEEHGFPGVTYIAILLGGLLPWTTYLPGAYIRMFPRRWRLRNASPAVMFLWLAALLPLIFFMFSKTKLPVYILPVLAPLTILMGALAVQWVQSSQRDGMLKHGAISMMITVGGFVILLAVLERLLGILSPAIILPAVVAAAVIAAMIVALVRNRRGWVLILSVAGVMASFLYLIIHIAPAGYNKKSMRQLARLIDPAEAKIARYYYWSDENRSFEYYADPGFIEQLKTSPEHQARRKAIAAAALQSDAPVYFFVTGKEALMQLHAAGRVRELGHIGRRWLVTNHRQNQAPPADTQPASQRASAPASAQGGHTSGKELAPETQPMSKEGLNILDWRLRHDAAGR
ncbi:MAG: glycosyltransferase family 39 protein [Planctomycetaceae bacterium]|nr:glycosyltransferase family 39 protein [Planctomycetaceae bacterium]